ncbi:PI3/PI4 protein kinase [Encephalitozoon intestinalis ATCC 50506]|uniref:non-specific serine/threonine protein kinase n=1 Tax=Encephalitozoon intestinalis (strain ATCC 50506) TaxID=876142 RepID=E0S5X1_ENCIT|nr:PI3/PI4 protein kinase [Encephalitozoon intestinalis ATCC 50506]ADM11106.1 PI3/PI4 protein kinase [Encephalitozoon intestinalis ATCC 50506]UTX44760.1 serine/threonine-protein kinase MEC1 [Encephalitozoon intestinalis]
MNRNYLKNLYLQQLESERYSDVFRESLHSLVSVEIMNTVILLAVKDDDEDALIDLLELFLQHLETNPIFYEKLGKSNLHLLLLERPLRMQSYTKLKLVYDKVRPKRTPLSFEHTEFLAKNFYNYCLYKYAYNDYQFDLEMSVEGFGPVEMNLFKDLLRKICIENRENEHLANYVRTLPMDTNVFLAIVEPDFKVDASKLEPEDLFVVYPAQVQRCNLGLFTKPFLCSLNSKEGLCRVCGRRVLEYHFEEIDHEEYLESIAGNIKEICFAVSHWEKARTPRVLITVLRSLFKGCEDLECYKSLKYFPVKEESDMEDIVVKFLRYAASTLNIENIQVSLRMLPFTSHTPKVIFSYFVILFESLRKYPENGFLRSIVKNVVMRNKDKFMKIRAMIFEYYMKGDEESVFDIPNREKEGRGLKDGKDFNTSISDRLERRLAPLSEFFSEECGSFVKNNMFYIYPIIYSLWLPRCTQDLGFTQANNHFLVISLCLQGEESRIDEIGYEKDELYGMGVDVIVPLLCNGYFKYDILERFFGDTRKYISIHLPKFLFALKKVYVERPFEFRVCVFKVLKCIIDAISNNVKMLFNYLFPFVEFFMRKHEDSCGMDCKMIFIEYYSSFFENDCFIRNMPRIFPYLDVEKIVKWSNAKNEEDYLDIVLGLLNTKGHFSQEMATSKAVELLTRVFGSIDKDGVLDEESFVENILTRFFKSPTFRIKVGSIYRRLREVESDAAFLIGCISQEFLEPEIHPSVCDVPIMGNTPEAIARVMIERYLLEIDPGKQDLHFFIIQETLKFIRGPLSDSIEEVVDQFRNTQYLYEHVPTYSTEKLYEKTHTFKKFLERLYRHTLSEVERRNKKEYFNLLRYGDLLGIPFLEFHCLSLCRLLLDSGDSRVAGIAQNISQDLEGGVDRKIARFVLKLHRFTEGKYVPDLVILRISIFLKDHYNAIQVLEKMIRKERRRDLFDLLQYNYYWIKDYDKVLGINSVFGRPTLINLFFGFCVDKNFAAARRCLEPEVILGNCTTESDDEEKGKDLIIQSLDMKDRLSEIIDECQDDEVMKFMNDCKRIEKDFSEWRNLESRNEVFKHFVKDCELVSKSKNLLKTLDLIAGRREMAGDDRMLLECHESLMAGIRSMVDGRDDISCDEMFESLFTLSKENVGESQDVGLEHREYFDDFASVDMVRAERHHERIGYIDRSRFGKTSGYNSLDEFERDLKLGMIRSYMGDNDFNKCIQEIGSMLLKREWSALYELAKLNVLQGKVGDAKTSLKKVLELFPRTSIFHKRALARYAEIVDTKTGYDSALSVLKDSGKLFLLGAKKFESTEPVKAMEMYINSVVHDSQYSDEAIPRIFHLFSEMTPPGDINASSALIKKFLESCLSLLPPYYNQILSRLSHPNRDVVDVVSNIVLELMENYPSKTFWRSLIMMNSQVPNTRKRMEGIISELTLDNKVVLSNIRKISEGLMEISKSKKNELAMEEDFPGFIRMFPTNVMVPNTGILINGVKNEIKVFNSLQRPKRICFVGNDGKNYYWLCKNQDDLRKDSRFMDLNLIINSILRKQSNKKYIRTYAVIPFSHESGIIEWIKGLNSLKVICDSYYSKDGISISETACRFVQNKKIGPREWHKVISKFGPKFHLWFSDNFPHPYSWLSARNNYTRTYAIMNIVGWFMGLGDRHAENILFDSNTGDTVHVDLNCIFGKGRELQVPEKVPYRLTQNIVDAFGVLGLEGSYNASLCSTLDLFLKNKNILVSNLLSFVYDPLFEWRRKSTTTPKRIIEDLCRKMDDLDVSSKCDVLNEEATKSENLCMMYIGWLPFI